MVNPETRKQVLRWGSAFAALLATGALWGGYNTEHGRYWMIKANGSFQFFFWGLASIAAVLWLMVYGAATSQEFARWGSARPVSRRWAWYGAVAVMVALALVVAGLIVSMPIA